MGNNLIVSVIFLALVKIDGIYPAMNYFQLVLYQIVTSDQRNDKLRYSIIEVKAYKILHDSL